MEPFMFLEIIMKVSFSFLSFFIFFLFFSVNYYFLFFVFVLKKGQLGLGHTGDVRKPEILLKDSSIASITSAWNHSMFLKVIFYLFIFEFIILFILFILFIFIIFYYFNFKLKEKWRTLCYG